MRVDSIFNLNAHKMTQLLVETIPVGDVLSVSGLNKMVEIHIMFLFSINPLSTYCTLMLR